MLEGRGLLVSGAIALALLLVAVAVGPSSSSSSSSPAAAASTSHAAPRPVTDATKYVLCHYRYRCGFNDKRTRWFYKAVRMAHEWDRALVQPWFNVRVTNDTQEEHFEPLHNFYSERALSGYIPHVRLEDFHKSRKGEVDVLVVNPSVARRVYGIQCEHRSWVPAAVAIPAAGIFTYSFTPKRMYCYSYPPHAPGEPHRIFPDQGWVQLREDLDAYTAVVFDGFDNHDDHGMMVDVTLGQGFQKRNVLVSESQSHIDYAETLYNEADRYLLQAGLEKGKYLAAHWRRHGHSAAKSPEVFVERVNAWLETLGVSGTNAVLFLATDCIYNDEIEYVYRNVRVPIVRYIPASATSPYSEPGRAALMDQVLCVLAKHFIGLEVSTFTEVIVEKRALNPSTTQKDAFL